MPTQRRTYAEFRAEVDRFVWQLVGMSIDDLPDVPLRDWYDDGDGPKAAARRAIRYAMEG